MEVKRKMSISESMRKTSEKFREQNPLIKTLYAVVEKYEDYVDDHWGTTEPGQRVGTWTFDTRKERAKWLEDHVPSKGREFILEIHEIREMRPKPYLQTFPKKDRS